MKKHILVLLALAVTTIISAQGWKNSNFLKGTENISVITSTTDSDNNMIVFGYFTGTLQPRNQADIASRGARDYFLAKYDDQSNELWVKGFGSTGLEFIQGGCVIGPDNSIYLTGGFQADYYYTDVDFLTSTGIHDIFLAKYDPDGNNVWCYNVGSGNSYQRATALNIDNTGNILLAGYYADSVNIKGDTTLYTNAFKDYFYGAFDSGTGDLIWAKALESIDSNFSGFIYSFAPADDHYVMTGVFADSVEIGSDTIVSESVNYYDTHVIKTDLNGEILWYRKVQGTLHDYSYNCVQDPDNNIYVTGYYNSSTLTIDSTATETIVINENQGIYDFFIAKYDTDGTLQWIRVNGGVGEDRLLKSSFFDGELWVAGYFADELPWGAQTLTTAGGAADTDAFYGSVDPDGNYTGATSYSGISSSREWGLSVFNDGDDLKAAIRTNSFEFVAGDSIYPKPDPNTGLLDFIVVGTIGCFPINVTEQFTIDVSDCFGDSTGVVSINATGGTNEGFRYALEPGFPYQASNTFTGVPGGVYIPKALDSDNCFGSGTNLTVEQPDEIVISAVDSTDVLCFGETTGTITVNASGGTGALNYSLDSTATFPFAVGSTANVGIGIFDSIAVQDDNDCVVFFDGTATIEQPDEITLTLDSIKNTLCNGTASGFIEMSATGGVLDYSFTINGTDFQPDSVFNAVSAGTYTITVRDANDCVVEGDEVVITEPDAIVLTLTPTDITCNGDGDGSIAASAVGGTPSYTFKLDDGEFSGFRSDTTYTDLAGGTYTITVRDTNDCEVIGDVIEINEPAVLVIDTVGTGGTHINTEYGPGFIEFSPPTGGTEPYTISIDPDAGTLDLENNQYTFETGEEGTYTITVTDANGCEAVSETSVIIGLMHYDFLNASIYPNPTSGNITIEFATEESELTMEMFSIDGKRVMSQQVFSIGGQVQETLDLSHLDKGIYMIRVDRRTIPSGVVVK